MSEKLRPATHREMVDADSYFQFALLLLLAKRRGRAFRVSRAALVALVGLPELPRLDLIPDNDGGYTVRWGVSAAEMVPGVSYIGVGTPPEPVP